MSAPGMPDFGPSLSPRMIRDIQDRADELGVDLRAVDPDGEDGVVITLGGSPTPQQVRGMSDTISGTRVTVEVDMPSQGESVRSTPTPSQGESVRSTPTSDQGQSVRSTPSDGVPGGVPGGGRGGGGGGPGGGGTDGALEGGPQTPRQVPGGADVWQVGNRHYLAYKVPGSNIPLVWQIENTEQREAILGTGEPDVDRRLTEAEFKRLSPWSMQGFAAELAITAENPWQVFMHEWDEAVELRPWLDDPTFQAASAAAYLEGREITRDELAQTDWWNEHTEAERNWMEESFLVGAKQTQRWRNDAKRNTAEALAQAGMDNAPESVANFIATQQLTGRWSESYTQEQIRKLTDPYARGELDRGLLAALRQPQWVTSGDARAISQGREAVRQRIADLWANRGIEPGGDGETPAEAIDRLTDDVLNDRRTIDDIRRSADFWAAKTEGGRPGGLDVTREGEEQVRSLAARWLGPTMGNFDEGRIAEWAGQIRNNPDAETELTEMLRQQRLSLFPNYENPNLTYEDIVQPFRNLTQQIWGEPPQDEALMVDLANMDSYADAQEELRRRGLQQGKRKPVQDMFRGLMSTGMGSAVQRSPI